MRNLVPVAVAALGFAGALSAQITFATQAQGPPLSPPPSTTPPDQKCVVEGRVTNAQTGEPLRKATVRLLRRGAPPGGAGAVFTPPSGYSATSESDGSFRIDGIEPGDYLLAGNRTGYLNTEYGAKSPGQPATTLTLHPAQQLTGIDLGLIPQSVITGKVVDDDGDPVPAAMVQVLRRTWLRGKLRYLPRGGAQTNDLGEFRSASLPAGTYYVCAEKMDFGGQPEAPPQPGKPDLRPVRTCYPEATTMQDAGQLQVRAGQDLADINIRMRSAQTYHVRGKVAGNLQTGDSQRARVFLTRRDEQMVFAGHQAGINKDQSFDIAGVAPGSYLLNAVVLGGPFRDLAQQPVDVGQGDVNDLVLSVIPPGSLHGSVRLENVPPAGTLAVNLASIHISLSPVDMGMPGRFPTGHANSDGAFTIDDVPAGHYYVHANTPNGTYLKSVRFGQQDITGSELDLSQSASGELDLVFRYGAAQVGGTVQTPQDASSNNPSAQPPPNASIVLIPDELNADGSGIHFGYTNQSGAFTLKGIPPGHYRIYAFEKINNAALQDPDLQKQLQSLGTDVEVKENDNKQVQVPLISADQTQQIFARLGIDSSQ